MPTPPDELVMEPMNELISRLRRRQVSPVELAKAYLKRIGYGDQFNAFISPPGEAAIRAARAAERRLARGDAGALLGVPIAIKDLFQTRGVRTTAGSRILRDWVPTRDAAVVARLKSAGAVIFGKTNLHEFAYGVTNANPWWGIARNPNNPWRIPGGSSGGSAITVVDGLAAAAMGSDTGGSIRIPASLCGCVGLKPTYGTVPLDGTFPLGWSLDHAGPLTATVDDAGVMFDVLSGSNVWATVRPDGQGMLRGVRVGMVYGALIEPVQLDVSAHVDILGDELKQHGLRVVKIQIPELEWTVATQLVTLRAEASAVHARWIRSRSRSYGQDVRVRLQLGTLVRGADYVFAQRMRARIREAMRRVFEKVDVLVLPTTPITAPEIDARTVAWGVHQEPVDAALVRLTAPFNLAGLPAMSVPCSIDDRHLPIGVQVVGRWNDEGRVLAVGRLVEELYQYEPNVLEARRPGRRSVVAHAVAQ
jgi:aspartyl-tRNA(Asn)/glutamyl-tRNA(Gln) amidotransferase subunit A